MEVDYQLDVAVPAEDVPIELVPFVASEAEALPALAARTVFPPEVATALCAPPACEAKVVEFPFVTSVDPVLLPADVLAEVTLPTVAIAADADPFALTWV